MDKIKVLLIALKIICFLIQQGSSSAIPIEYDEKISHLKAKLSNAINEQSENLIKGKERLKSVTSAAEESLRFELEQLRQYMRETQVEAAEENYDISVCLNETSLNSISVESIRICQKQPSAQYIQDELDHLLGKYDTLFADMTACIENTELDTNDCIDNEIAQVEIKISVLEVLVEHLLSTAYELCFKCSKIHLTQLDKDIIFIARNFTTCIDDIMGQ